MRRAKGWRSSTLQVKLKLTNSRTWYEAEYDQSTYQFNSWRKDVLQTLIKGCCVRSQLGRRHDLAVLTPKGMPASASDYRNRTIKKWEEYLQACRL